MAVPVASRVSMDDIRVNAGCDRREQAPDCHSLQRQQAVITKKCRRIRRKPLEKEWNRKWYRRCLKQPFAGPVVGDEQGQLQWPGGVVDELDDGLIEAQNDRGQSAKDGGAAKDRATAENQAKGRRECEVFRSHSLLQPGHDRRRHPAVPDAGTPFSQRVAGGRGAGRIVLPGAHLGRGIHRCGG